MTLRQRNGHWHYRFQYQGQEYTGSTDLAATPQNMKDATTIEAVVLQELKQGRTPASQIVAITFRDAVGKFLPAAEVRYRAKPNSYRRIKTSLSSAQVFFDKLPVRSIDAAQIDEYKTWRAAVHEVKDVTIRHDLHALSKFFQHAMRHRWASANPIREVEIPSDADAVRMYVLTYEEEEDYYRRTTHLPDLHDVAVLMINQGLRPEEAISLRKEDVDLEQRTVFIRRGKTKAARRLLDLTAASVEVLRKRMVGSSVWVFSSSRKEGSHIGPLNSAHDRVVAHAAKEGVEINFVMYDFRHTFATRAAQINTDLVTIAALLGHGSTRCVHKYVHPTADHKKLAMQNLDRKNQEEIRKAKLNSKRAA